VCCVQHPAICEFPSKQFYDGRLKSADHSSEWEGGRVINVWRHKACPLVFCHVEGVEKSQTVSTAEGNEQSKSNEQEKHHAVGDRRS
jgi:superfamily I DNA and/or RNA helicase